MDLYTLGHSAHPISHILFLLKLHQLETLVDVRSKPASRFHPQFNQRALEQALSEEGIAYVYLGQVLGGRPTDPTLYDPPAKGRKENQPPQHANFSRMMKREEFQQGIAELLAVAEKSRTVILCSEKDPTQCHRHLLIAEYLRDHHPFVKVQHILADGSLQAASELWPKF